MKLTGREKSSLILEGVITVILLILLDMAIITIAQDVIQSNPGINEDRANAGANLELPADPDCHFSCD